MEIRQGIDITSVRRMKKTIERRGMFFVRRVFTSGERRYCENKRMKYEHYAARFAAKEAVIKAIGVDSSSPRFREIEIRRHATGKPYIYLSRRTRQSFGLPSKFQIELSLAHEREYAIASVIILFLRGRKKDEK